MARGIVLIALSLTTNTALAASAYVNCNHGQSLNSVLAHLDPHVPNTVSVRGTCTENVLVEGFDGLTLNGLSGATLVQPTNAAVGGTASVLLIDASRSVTVSGFTIDAPKTGNTGIGIGHGSSDIRLSNLTINGGASGIVLFEHSQASMSQITARDPGYAPVGLYDLSEMHIEGGCLFEITDGSTWHVGVDVASGHLTIRGATIENMQVGIWVRGGGSANIQNTTNYFPDSGSTDVVIENPAGANQTGVWIQENGTLAVADAALRITNAGQAYGGTSGGVLVDGASTLDGDNNLIVSGSQGQGIIVMDGSHAFLSGSSITGGQHGGLVVGNLSSLSMSGATNVSGNAVDVFCDAQSVISGSANIAGAHTVQCSNLVAGVAASLP